MTSWMSHGGPGKGLEAPGASRTRGLRGTRALRRGPTRPGPLSGPSAPHTSAVLADRAQGGHQRGPREAFGGWISAQRRERGVRGPGARGPVPTALPGREGLGERRARARGVHREALPLAGALEWGRTVPHHGEEMPSSACLCRCVWSRSGSGRAPGSLQTGSRVCRVTVCPACTTRVVQLGSALTGSTSFHVTPVPPCPVPPGGQRLIGPARPRARPWPWPG